MQPQKWKIVNSVPNVALNLTPMQNSASVAALNYNFFYISFFFQILRKIKTLKKEAYN